MKKIFLTTLAVGFIITNLLLSSTNKNPFNTKLEEIINISKADEEQYGNNQAGYCVECLIVDPQIGVVVGVEIHCMYHPGSYCIPTFCTAGFC